VTLSSRAAWLGRWLPIGTVVACLVISERSVLRHWSTLWTDDDQAFLWLAARDLVHGGLQQPTFYGQNYNTVFEVIPGAVLHHFGVTYSVAIPVSCVMFAVACWWVLGLAALLRGHRTMAILADAAPLVLGTQYLVLAAAPRGVLAGHLAGCIAVGVVVLFPENWPALCVGVALGSLGLAWDVSTLLVVLPALTAAAVQQRAALGRRSFTSPWPPPVRRSAGRGP
jgi:hypothetical protein